VLARGVLSRKWSRRSKVFAALAVVSGAGAFALVDGYAARLEELRPVAGEPVPVVVAATALARGEVLSEDALRVELVPAAFAPPGRVSSPGSLAGRTLVSDVAEGEAITRTRLGVGGGPVATLVPDGLRAFPVTAGGAAGAVRAGDRVDVLATFGGPRPYTETVASGLEVLTILRPDEGMFAAGGTGGPTLVLLVGPEVAEELAYATAFADLAVAIAPATVTADP
jgi:Flp pilus assembly protein CpaB